MANNAIDKSLDEIITSTGISANSRKPQNKGSKKQRGSLKSLGQALKASRQEPRKRAKKPTVSTRSMNPLALAKRAVVSNLPLDIDERAVAQYFGQRVGPVLKAEGSFRENGKPTGTYTLTFEKPGCAQKLLEKFHNELVDGKRRLNVQILLDAITAAPPSLDGRIGPSSKAGGKQNANSNLNRSSATKKKVDAPRKAVEDKPKAKKAPKKTKAKVKAEPRTKEELDADMADYFSKAGDNEISV